MKQKETIRSLWMPTAGMLDGVRRVAMLLLTTLLLSMISQTAWAQSPDDPDLGGKTLVALVATVTSGSTTENYSVGDTYATPDAALKAAVENASNRSEVKLYADITAEICSLVVKKSMIIDLNGHSISVSSGNIFAMHVYEELTVKNGTLSSGSEALYVSRGVVVLENTTIRSTTPNDRCVSISLGDGTLTISKGLTLGGSIDNYQGTVQIADGQVLKYTDDGGQVHLLCGTLDADAINALANKDITFFGNAGGYCGQDNSETTDVDESKNVMWCISPDDPATADIDESKVLTISGTGLMMYYNSIQNADATWSNGAPWKAFANDIEKVIIKDGITYVGSNTFAHCPNISSVTLPESGLYQIGPGAFADCTSLTSIDIPMSVNNIGDQAFAGCSNLETVSIGYGEAASFTIGTEVFPATTTIFVPKASLSGYLAATDWSTYQIAPAILKSIVTQDNFSNFFDESGNLQDNTSDELIFQGEFSGLTSYIALDRPITVTGDNAVLNNMGFSIVSDDVSLNNMTLVSNTDLGYLIYVDASNVTLDNLSVTYNAPSEVEAEAIFANGAENFALTNSEIIFTGANPGEKHYRGLEVRNSNGAKIDNNTITATFPAVAVDWGKTGIDQDLVLAVGIQGGDDVAFTNNTVKVNTNGSIGDYSTIDAVMVYSSDDILIKGNNITHLDKTTEDSPRYYYTLDIYSTTGTVEANNINVNTIGTAGIDRAGSAFLIQLTGPFTVTVKDNNLTGISKGSITGIYASNNWSGEGESNLTVENNNINVTGYATTDYNDLVAGIEAEIDGLKAYNNTIAVKNTADYDDDNHVIGVGIGSSFFYGDTSADIKDNNMIVDGKYAVYYKEAEDTEVTGNALCAHELFGDAAVFIESGDNNTVENNILGYVIPKTGENTYNIPANVSSFKVYDDGGKGRIYSPGCDGTLTLTAPEGYVLQLSGNITTEKDVDYLTVYDGSSNQTDVLINQVSSSVSGELTDIPTVTSTGQSMTLYFYSDNSDSGNSEFDGLDLTVTLGKNIAACNITVPNQTMERFGGGYPYSYIYFKFEDAENNPTSNVIGEVVKDGETTLTLGTDYKFGQITFAEPSTHDEKDNPCKPGDKCRVEIIGLGTYVGTAYADFTIISPSANGTYGDLSWSVADGTLSITGTGAMTAAATTAYPWYQYCSIITSVTIGDGVTSIADNAFGSVPNMYTYNNVAKVTIPASVTSIGADAFKGCITATDVYCYADPTKLTWGDTGDDFKSGKETKCHVADESAWSSFSSVNVDFVGDLAEKSIPYIDADGKMAYCTDYTVLTGSETSLTGGWYVVNSDVSFDHSVTLTGPVNLILADGKTMNIGSNSDKISGYALNGGDHTTSALTVYGQSEGTGSLKVYATYTASEYSQSEGKGISLKGNYIQHGGNVTIDGTTTSSYGATGIAACNVAISGGVLTISSSLLSFCINATGTFTLSRGTVNVKKTNGSSVNINVKGDITVSGGILNATSTGGTVISGGSKIYLNGGTVTANNSASTGYGIKGNVTLSGSTLTTRSFDTWQNASSVTIADGLAYTDGMNVYTSTTPSASLTALENVTLQPITGVTLTDDGEGNLTAEFDGTSLTTLSIPGDVTVNAINFGREFTKGVPVTLMLPFSLADGQTFTGGTLYKFSGISKNSGTGNWEATMTESATLHANTPYLMMPNSSLSSSGKVTIGLNSNPVTLNTTTAGESSVTTDASDWEFKGSYEERHWYDGTDGVHAASNADEIGKVYGFAATSGKATDGVTDIAAGQFVRFASGAWIRPTRCYLIYNGTGTPGAGARNKRAAAGGELPDKITVRLIGLNGTTTAIGTLDTKTGELSFDEWYTLDGRRLDGKPTKSGVYINNGKKIVVK